jgi:hypothetical protein
MSTKFLFTAMVPQGIRIMYIVECTFAGETSTLAAEFTDLVDAARAASPYFDDGYDIAIAHKGTDSRIIATHARDNVLRPFATYAGA